MMVSVFKPGMQQLQSRNAQPGFFSSNNEIQMIKLPCEQQHVITSHFTPLSLAVWKVTVGNQVLVLSQHPQTHDCTTTGRMQSDTKCCGSGYASLYPRAIWGQPEQCLCLAPLQRGNKHHLTYKQKLENYVFCGSHRERSISLYAACMS